VFDRESDAVLEIGRHSVSRYKKEEKTTTVIFDMPQINQGGDKSSGAIINTWTLSFDDPNIETEYASFFTQNNMVMWRIGLLIGLTVSLVLFFYSGLDGHTPIVEESLFVAFSVMFPLVALLCASYMMAVRQKQTAKYAHHISTFAITVIGGVAISVRHYLLEREESPYKPGLFYILMLLGAHAMLRIRYLYLALCMPLLLAIYISEEAISISGSFKRAQDLFISTICLAAAMMVIVTSSYTAERASRQEFSNARTAAKTTSKLIEQLKKLHKTYSHQVADFDSPLEKSIMLVKSILADPSLQRDHINSLANLLALLRSNDLMTPDIEKQVEGGWVDLDKEQEAWLFSNLYRNRQASKPGVVKRAGSLVHDRNRQSERALIDDSPFHHVKKVVIGGESCHPPPIGRTKTISSHANTPRKKSFGDKPDKTFQTKHSNDIVSEKRPSLLKTAAEKDQASANAARRRPSLVQQMFKEKAADGRRPSCVSKNTKQSLESLKSSQNQINVEKEANVDLLSPLVPTAEAKRSSISDVMSERSRHISNQPYESLFASEVAHVVLSIGSISNPEAISKFTYLESLDSEIDKLPTAFIVYDTMLTTVPTADFQNLNTIKEGEEDLGSVVSFEKQKLLLHDASLILSSPEEVASHIGIVSLLERSG